MVVAFKFEPNSIKRRIVSSDLPLAHATNKGV